MWSDAFGGQLLAPLAGLSAPPPTPHLELLLIKGTALSRLRHPTPDSANPPASTHQRL